MPEQINELKSGQPVSSNDHEQFEHCVAIINEGHIIGTGVLIAPDIVMTAYHVITSISGNTVKVSNGLKAFSSNLFKGSKIPREYNIIIPNETLKDRDKPCSLGVCPDKLSYSNEPDRRQIGLGFILLGISLPDMKVKFASEEEVKGEYVGQIVGYGRNSDGDYGVKSITDVRIAPDDQGDIRTKAIISRDGQKDGINPTDSGGPLYIKSTDKPLKLAGIANNHIAFGRLGRFIDVTMFKDKINEIVKDNCKDKQYVEELITKIAEANSKDPKQS
jgi:hypothetical protein